MDGYTAESGKQTCSLCCPAEFHFAEQAVSKHGISHRPGRQRVINLLGAQAKDLGSETERSEARPSKCRL